MVFSVARISLKIFVIILCDITDQKNFSMCIIIFEIAVKSVKIKESRMNSTCYYWYVHNAIVNLFSRNRCLTSKLVCSRKVTLISPAEDSCLYYSLAMTRIILL